MYYGIVYTYFIHPNIFTRMSVDAEDILMFGCEKIIITNKLEIVLQIRVKGNQKMDKNLDFVSCGRYCLY
jgi:hypothetical protein